MSVVFRVVVAVYMVAFEELEITDELQDVTAVMKAAARAVKFGDVDAVEVIWRKDLEILISFDETIEYILNILKNQNW